MAALKEGAADFLTKPFDIDQLLHRLVSIERHRAMRSELDTARAALATRNVGSPIIGRSPAIARMLDRLETFAASDAPVLITGESGTGKELVARTLHDHSPRCAKPFVAVNCAAFPETLLEAELFGHERGAFTGAVKRRDGRFRAAHGGTLFLDEVAEVPLPAQAKLLRVLQEGVFEPLGTNTPVQVDVRIVSATHRNLKDRIAQGTFREDLFYRLNVLQLPIPALRDRRGDLPLLAEHFLRRFRPDASPPLRISGRAWAAIVDYPFPGNVRELEHALQHACVLARGAELDLQHLPADLAGTDLDETVTDPRQIRPLVEAIHEFEREYLVRALRHTDGRKAEAARVLGISRKSLWEKLRAYGDGEPRAQPTPPVSIESSASVARSRQ